MSHQVSSICVLQARQDASHNGSTCYTKVNHYLSTLQNVAHSNSEPASTSEQQPFPSTICRSQCKLLLHSMEVLAARELVLDDDNQGETLELALYSVWLARHACERASQDVQQALSTGPAHLSGRCVALQTYRTSIDDLGARPAGWDDMSGIT